MKYLNARAINAFMLLSIPACAADPSMGISDNGMTDQDELSSPDSKSLEPNAALWLTSSTRCTPRWQHQDLSPGSLRVDWFQACVRMEIGSDHRVRDQISLTGSRTMAVQFQVHGLWRSDVSILGPFTRDGVKTNETVWVPITNHGHGADPAVAVYAPGAVLRNIWPDGTVGGWATLDGDSCNRDQNEFIACIQR
jgi:hypothetical protein